MSDGPPTMRSLRVTSPKSAKVACTGCSTCTDAIALNHRKFQRVVAWGRRWRSWRTEVRSNPRHQRRQIRIEGSILQTRDRPCR